MNLEKVFVDYLEMILREKFNSSIVEVKRASNSRHGKHCRISTKTENLQKIFGNKNLFGVSLSISDSNKSYSGKFPTYKVTLNETSKIFGWEIKKGFCAYVVNVFSSKNGGSLKDKDFTPDYFGFNGKTFGVDELIRSTKQFINSDKKCRVFSNVLNFFIDKSFNKATRNLENETDGDIVFSDMNIISKNFGEITSAIYLLSNVDEFKGCKVFFPSASNEPLVDFYIVDDKNKLRTPFSVKNKSGGPPSLKIVYDKLVKLSDRDREIHPCWKIVKSLFEFDGIDGVIELSRIVDKSKSYKFLKENFDLNDFGRVGGDKKYFQNKIDSMLSNDKTSKEILENFYRLIGKRSDSVDDVLSTNELQNSGLISSPLGYYLKEIINKDEDLVEDLNNIIREISVTQIYTSLSLKNVYYVIVPFFDGTFEFFFNATSRLPKNKKFSFKMVH